MATANQPYQFKVTLAEGMVLCGWGKAKFRELTTDKPLDSDTEILFEADATTVGVLDNKYGTVADFLGAAKVMKPNTVKVCYHKCTQDPEGNWILVKDFWLD